jgi:predicted TIM-barrel fold metal-dependent hydrolase
MNRGRRPIESATDHNALVGAYPFRHLPEPTPERLRSELERLGIQRAWVGHVPSIFYRDVAAGNDELLELLSPHGDILLPVPAVNPAFAGWERELARARSAGAPAVRTYPVHYGFDCAGSAMRELASACAEAGLVLVLTVRLEDARQRHRLDAAAELIGADVRATIRAHPLVRVLVVAADRSLIEEAHYGATADEAARLRYDISWIWGPPEDHLGRLIRDLGAERFVFGTHFPFRLPEAALAKVMLLTT